MFVVTHTSYRSGWVSTNIANESTIATSGLDVGIRARHFANTSRNSRQPVRTLCLTMQVTRFLPSPGAPRPRSRDNANAFSITRFDARRVITRRSVARSGVRSAIPEYRPSVFSRTMTMSTWSKRVVTLGRFRTGRTAA
jgi:hypothetical protein